MTVVLTAYYKTMTFLIQSLEISSNRSVFLSSIESLHFSARLKLRFSRIRSIAIVLNWLEEGQESRFLSRKFMKFLKSSLPELLTQVSQLPGEQDFVQLCQVESLECSITILLKCLQQALRLKYHLILKISVRKKALLMLLNTEWACSTKIQRYYSWKTKRLK